MSDNKTINNYFIDFQESLRCKKINHNMGYKYSFLGEGKKSEITRFILDNNLEASISKVKFNKSYSFKYIDKSDLLIIGLCLEGNKIIEYKGKNLIGEGDIFYFRPTKDFKIHCLEHRCLHYFLDLNSLEKPLNYKNCNNCNYCGDKICSRGELNIEKIPYVMKSRINEIKDMRNMEIDSLSSYVGIKSQLFKYLDWLIKLKKDAFVNNKEWCLCPVSGAKEIIIENLEKPLIVKEIAKNLGVSTYKLQKAFKKKEGTTVYDFIRKTKIDNSKMLLKESNFSIIDISQKIGYENPSKFSTAFKDITGYTPTEYRKIRKD